MQNSIDYVRMYEDGICEVEAGLFSKTIRFADINYQIARRDDQIDIFTRYCEILNYFDPSINLQITISNRSIDKEDFQQQVLLPYQEDGLDHFRREYNEMLLDKALQGENSIVREKYLTFGLHADGYEAAKAALARVETDILNNFRNLGCDVQVLTGYDRCEYLYKFFNPEEPFNFDYDFLLYSSLKTKDIIAPDSFDFSDKRSFVMGETYGQVLFLKDLPPDLGDKLLRELSEIPCNMTINLHINSVEQDKAFDLVRRQIAYMELQKIDESKKAIKSGYDPEMIPHELRHSLLEAEELLDDLQNKNQRMFKVTISICTTARSKEALDDNIYQIMSVARKNNCKMGYLDYMQEAGLNNSIPIGKNHLPMKRTLTTSSTAIFIPFTAQELTQSGGMYYGLNALSHNLILFNRKSLKNGNSFRLGTPGSGKSFLAKEEMVAVLLATTDDEVIVIDPEREYTPLAQGFGDMAQIIHVSAGSKTHINPLDINMDYSDDDDPLLLKSEFVLSLCELLVGGRGGITAKERSIIDRSISLTYAAHFNNPKNVPVPTLLDFHKVLSSQPEPEAQNIALALEIYTKGSLSVFSKPTNIEIENKRFVIYDIKDLGKQLRSLGMLVTLDQIWVRITENRKLGKRTWLYIDEIYLLFANEYSANYLFELYKRARKWGCLPCGITQNVEDLLLSDQARRMLSNSDCIVMLNQSGPDRKELAKLLNISPEQLNYVTNARAGQGLLFTGSSIIPFVDNFPTHTELYKMMTTKIEEVASAK